MSAVVNIHTLQLATISYGEEKLVTQDERQFEQNRRCEFKVSRWAAPRR